MEDLATLFSLADKWIPELKSGVRTVKDGFCSRNSKFVKTAEIIEDVLVIMFQDRRLEM